MKHNYKIISLAYLENLVKKQEEKEFKEKQKQKEGAVMLKFELKLGGANKISIL